MPDLDLIAVLAATVVAFVLGGAYYAVLGQQLAAVSEAATDDHRPWELVVELVRCLIMATVVAGIASQGRVDHWLGGLVLGLALWIGFPLVLWVGAMVHEKVPWRLAVIHAGDWLAKLLAVSILVSVLQ